MEEIITGGTRETWYGFNDWCAICWSELKHRPMGRRRAEACTTCLRLDAMLGRSHDASLMTPIDECAGLVRGVVFNRLHPDDDEFSSRLEGYRSAGMAPRAGTLRSRARPDGVVPVRRFPGGSYCWVDRAPLQALYPPGPATTAAAYARYAAEVHPWMAEVDARVTDTDVLLALATD